VGTPHLYILLKRHVFKIQSIPDEHQENHFHCYLGLLYELNLLDTILSIPMGPHLSIDEADYAIMKIKEFFLKINPFYSILRNAYAKS
jgi:hypothetical protein